MRRIWTTAYWLAAIGVLLALGGCGGGSADGSAPSSTVSPGTNGEQALPPIIVGLSDLANSTVEINGKQPLVINVGSSPVDSWAAIETIPAGIVEFIPGHDDGSAQYNPGFSAMAPGEAEVVLHNSTDASQPDIRFRIVVTNVP